RQPKILGAHGRFIGLCRRVEDVRVDHSVTVEKDRSMSRQIADSHFISFCFSLGCDTIKCQTTAWNASVCGVTVSVETVGTITHAVATFAVYPPSRPTTPTILAPTCCASFSASTILPLIPF